MINKLDLAINEIENLESQLSSYDEILDHVRTTIEKMEQKNALIKVVNENNEKLLSRLEKVVVSSHLYFSTYDNFQILNLCVCVDILESVGTIT